VLELSVPEEAVSLGIRVRLCVVDRVLPACRTEAV
jgi:hypothetical protein